MQRPASAGDMAGSTLQCGIAGGRPQGPLSGNAMDAALHCLGQLHCRGQCNANLKCIALPGPCNANLSPGQCNANSGLKCIALPGPGIAMQCEGPWQCLWCSNSHVVSWGEAEEAQTQWGEGGGGGKCYHSLLLGIPPADSDEHWRTGNAPQTRPNQSDFSRTRLIVGLMMS